MYHCSLDINILPKHTVFKHFHKGGIHNEVTKGESYEECSRTFQHMKCNMSSTVKATEVLALEVPLHPS
jgi:hypothetical protein